METYRLASAHDLKVASDALRDAPLDGSVVMAIRPKGTKSQRQRAYQWLLYRTIASSGKGDADTPEEVDLRSKWRARHIWLADDDLALSIYKYVCEEYPEQRKKWVEDYLHTESLSVSQMAVYLTSIINFYGEHIELPYPDHDILEY